MSLQAISPRIRRGCLLAASAISIALVLTACTGPTTAEGGDPTTAVSTADLNDATIESLQAQLANGDLTAVELSELYVERIEAMNTRGPGLNAVRALNPDWKKDAAAADARRADGESGPLLGIPILVKDNIDVDGMPTTAGSLALAASYPAGDATTIAALKDAGAVILGKTNLLEFAGGYSFSQSQGHSSIGGMTLNPYDVSVDYLGSSIGSASAAAAGLAAATLGTDTGGSMLAPSSISNLVAIRPTMGLVSRAGSIPQQDTRDVIGPMARSVHDAAALLTALADGADEADPVTAGGESLSDTDFTSALDDSALRGARIGIAVGSYREMTADQLATWNQALADLDAEGAVLVPFHEKLVTSGSGAPILFAYEFADKFDDYLRTLPKDAPIQSFEDLQAFIVENPETTKFTSSTIDTAAAIDLAADKAEYEAARQSATDETLGVVTKLRAAYDLDAIAFPAGWSVYTSSLGGLPAITVPAGAIASTSNPWAISLLGTEPYSDAQIIGYAYDYEQATHHWFSPFTRNESLFRCVDEVGGDSDDPTCAP